MTLSKLARKNIIRNIRQYLLYLYSLVFSTAIYFTFVSFQDNQQLLSSTVTIGKLESAFFAASMILMIFSGSFIWYSNSFFTRMRKKEVGLYALFGMSKKKIALLLFYENMIIGALALVIGIGAGILFSKLFMMIIFKLMGFSLQASFSVSSRAMLQTIVVFLIILLVTSIHSYRLIYRFSLTELFKADRKGERLAKGSIITSILAVVLIGVSYLLFWNPEKFTIIHNTGIRFGTAVFFLVAGSYFFMNSLAAYLLKLMKRLERVYLKGKNLLGITNLLYRFKGNVLILTVISLLSSVTLLACGTILGFYYHIDRVTNEHFPYSYMFNMKDDEVNKEIAALIVRASEDNPRYQLNLEYLPVEADLNGMERVPDFFQTMLISENTFQKLMEKRGRPESLHLKRNEAAAFYDGNLDVKSDPYSGKQLVLKAGQELTITTYKLFSLLNQGEMLFPLVISNAQYEELKEGISPQYLHIYKLKNEKSLEKLDSKLEKIVRPLQFNDNLPIYSSFYDKYHNGLETYGLLIYICGFLGLVFMAATGSIIYFKQLMEAASDKARYQTLRKIGIPEQEIKKTVARQVGFVFVLPLLLAVSHSAMITYLLSEFLQIPLQVPFMIFLGAYLVIYLIYYLMTTAGYVRLIKTSS
ncbi:FtsX-like permease family protein [Neobacillus sp. GCM10023253]|uniref:FtsX-like permease family protein n=1 Tax=Neobacillus sp. GCM10023253 TaxID=3252644 RepID=UPI00360C73BB